MLKKRSLQYRNAMTTQAPSDAAVSLCPLHEPCILIRPVGRILPCLEADFKREAPCSRPARPTESCACDHQSVRICNDFVILANLVDLLELVAHLFYDWHVTFPQQLSRKQQPPAISRRLMSLILTASHSIPTLDPATGVAHRHRCGEGLYYGLVWIGARARGRLAVAARGRRGSNRAPTVDEMGAILALTDDCCPQDAWRRWRPVFMRSAPVGGRCRRACP